jgi:hypothetical protein
MDVKSEQEKRERERDGRRKVRERKRDWECKGMKKSGKIVKIKEKETYRVTYRARGNVSRERDRQTKGERKRERQTSRERERETD